MSAFDRDSVHSVCAAIQTPLYQNTKQTTKNQNDTNTSSSPFFCFSRRSLLLSACVVLLLFAIFAAQPAAAATGADSPVSSLDPSDVAPLSDSEVDTRVEALMKWVDSNVLRIPKKDADPHFDANKKKKNGKGNTKKKSPSQWLADERSNEDDDDDDNNNKNKNEEVEEEYSDEGSDFVFPLEIRRGSRVSYEKSQHDPLQQTLRVFARRDVRAGHVAIRLPAKLILSYTTLCPHIHNNNNHNKKKKSSNNNADDGEQEDDGGGDLAEFCRLVAALRQHALSSETCSQDTAHFFQGFQTAVLSLFLVYMRWGAGATAAAAAAASSASSAYSSSPSAAFYKPYVDLIPRVPPTPICAFTDADLDLFELSGLARSERERATGQWHFFFDQIASNYSRVFPRDSLTLPRYLWAHCSVKARMMGCFSTNEPCLVPVVDAAGHASFLGTNYASRLTMAVQTQTQQEQSGNQQQQQQQKKRRRKKKKKINKKTGEVIVDQEETSSSNNDDNNNKILALDMKFETHLTAGRELLFDRDHSESAFLHRGALDGAYEAVKFRCNAVQLPRNISSKQKSKSQDDVDGGDTEMEQDDDEKQQQQQQPASSSADTDPFESLHNPCVDRFLAVPSSLVNPSLLSSNNNQDEHANPRDLHHHPYMCLREHELFHTLSVIEQMQVYDPQCNPRRVQQQRAKPSTTETRLRAVAFLGKLVRFQLERLSEALNEIERVVGGGGASSSFASSASSSSASSSAGKAFAHRAVDEGAFGESETAAFSGAGKKKMNKNNKNKKKSSSSSNKNNKEHHHDDDCSSSSCSSSSSSLPSHVLAAMSQTSLCASWGFASNGGVVGATLNDNARNPDASRGGYFPSSSSSSTVAASAAGKACRIFESSSSDAKHALVIRDWTIQEHEALLSIYEQLVKLRNTLRKQLVAESE